MYDHSLLALLRQIETEGDTCLAARSLPGKVSEDNVRLAIGFTSDQANWAPLAALLAIAHESQRTWEVLKKYLKLMEMPWNNTIPMSLPFLGDLNVMSFGDGRFEKRKVALPLPGGKYFFTVACGSEGKYFPGDKYPVRLAEHWRALHADAPLFWVKICGDTRHFPAHEGRFQKCYIAPTGIIPFEFDQNLGGIDGNWVLIDVTPHLHGYLGVAVTLPRAVVEAQVNALISGPRLHNDARGGS